PSEVVFDLLDRLPAGPLFKEDGQMVIDENGNRI
ncbi:arsenate reductase (glutaredoxin), partial [Rhodovulum sulfidophilum]|nr:arsenate reductase (glutaredoxin) [Rhodovulum sulfidophilum]MCE8421075.1 arsenate reductase (glutaredoxin) [Rhodovulum sulfidophilum]